MTLDEIRSQLGRARGMPRAALLAAVHEAEALEPEVIDLIDLACKGILLTLPQHLLMFYGIHALAAARRTGLHAPLLALIESRPYDLELFLSDAELHALLISTCGPDEEPPYDLLQSSTVPGDIKNDLFLLIAWMVRQGRAPREEFIAFLDRFDRKAAEDSDDPVWFGWQSAIALLGLIDFEERVQAGWRAGRMKDDRPLEKAEWLEELRRSARNPQDDWLFAAHHALPITDVFASLRWMEVLGLDQPPEEGEADDPARDIRLTSDERDWLITFLRDECAPADVMSLECIDGFHAAVAAGPKEIPREEWETRIWSDLEDDAPAFETEAQEAYARELIGRHFDTIRRRLGAGYRIQPVIDEESEVELVEDWAIGFAIGMDMRPGSWDPIGRHKQGSFAVASIYILLPPDRLGAEGEELEPMDSGSRATIVSNLPDLVRTMYAFWHDQPVLPLFAPRRSQKVGRNDPCPCGSGRKYKKCCGATATN